jgi:hypothetical protein
MTSVEKTQDESVQAVPDSNDHTVAAGPADSSGSSAPGVPSDWSVPSPSERRSADVERRLADMECAVRRLEWAVRRLQQKTEHVKLRLPIDISSGRR